MRKVICALCCVALLSSCYTSKVVVGEAAGSYEKAGTVKNHLLIAGLIPLKNEHSAKDFVGGSPNYVVQTQHSFVDMLVSGITGGIYTPTTTTIFVPAN